MKIDKPVNKPVIVALDFPDTASALSLIDRLDPELCRLKVGKELPDHKVGKVMMVKWDQMVQ